ncbi:hypothetical protein [Nocardia australiensis]|uniref:hypothetical protein n=1 Tax=Nocardia australiensis TaxID=2887191 RepID=UPI001D153EFA|nr:hypothetical protein [Nocardia australiensis]
MLAKLDDSAMICGLFGVPEKRGAACELAGDLIRRRRGDHLELISALADDLDEPLWAPAKVLSGLGPAVVPVADRLFDELAQWRLVAELPADPEPPMHLRQPGRKFTTAWLLLSGDGRSPNYVGPLLQAVANTGDPRAVAPVRRVLELDELPFGLADLLEPLGAHALELVPLIRRRMVESHARTSPENLVRAQQLARALGRIGDSAAEAVEEVAAIADGAWVLEVLRGFGAGANSAVPVVLPFLDAAEPRVRLEAAATLWHLTGDPEPASAELSVALSNGRVRATEVAAQLGRTASACAPQLRRMVDSESPAISTPAAIALWRVTGEPEPTVSALLAPGAARFVGLSDGDPNDWDISTSKLSAVANCFTELGTAAAAAAPLLASELAKTRRIHPSVGFDREIYRACERALAAVTT